ncbi:hypothetical protein BKH41_02695 [Helicobacter sp. 12S02232-10]|uniref:DDE-type integrase/transposase/recombinase n=1 Tax=Helicobacter sp. 12S02232-10 TaxID=1476197 RepID=UPI000BA7CAB3|nr:DDE-type integrase/transposase/recombinase [Helicobacter sp. 12S02232-10]PAF49591.1 hypothetical protein BKH41_02695 [Helicobacter sp. 12S02232-10]
MREWLNAENFLKNLKKFNPKYDINIVSIRTIRRKAKESSSSFFVLNGDFFYFRYIKGIGRGGKVLQIWSEPIDPADLEAFENNIINTNTGESNERNTHRNVICAHSHSYADDRLVESPTTLSGRNRHIRGGGRREPHPQPKRQGVENGDVSYLLPDTCNDDLWLSSPSSRVLGLKVKNNQNKNDLPLTPFAKASIQVQEKAMLRARVVKEWESAKVKGIKEGDFIQSINSSRLYSFILTPAKLYSWQRAYRDFGIDGLIDERGKHRENAGIIQSNPTIQDLVVRLILASKARFNLALIYESAHFNLWKMGLFEDLEGFLKKQSYLFSYNTLKRFIDSYLGDHREVKLLVEGGETRLDSQMLPAVGDASWAASSINEIVEIDASPIDVILDVPRLCRDYNYDIDTMEMVQARYSLISLIDVYSRVCIFHVCESENSLGVARAIAKYILTYGKPKTIKGDNGRAFKSKYVQEVCLKLGIDFTHTAPYSGWLKPYVESNFKKLQHKAVELMAGYIGHNVGQRKSIEEFNSRKERRLLKGEKTHLKGLLTLQEFEGQIEVYNKIALSKINAKLGDSPINVYNQRSHEAVGMSEYELTFYLSHLEERRVGKGGVMLNNTLYQLPELYEHSRVFAGININNVAQAFIYDKDKKFLDVALAQGTYEDTLEVAKQSRKVFERAKKKVKEEIVKARAKVESETPELYKEVASKLTSVKKPKVTPINSELEHSRIRSEVKRAAGSEYMELMISKKEKKKEKKKKNKKELKKLTWEQIAGIKT